MSQKESTDLFLELGQMLKFIAPSNSAINNKNYYIEYLDNNIAKLINDTDLDEELRQEYNQALEKIETALYPDERKTFLKQAHKNLIEIMSQEIKYYDKIDKVNNHESINDSDDSSLSSDEKLNHSSARTNQINDKHVLQVLEEQEDENSL